MGPGRAGAAAAGHHGEYREGFLPGVGDGEGAAHRAVFLAHLSEVVYGLVDLERGVESQRQKKSQQSIHIVSKVTKNRRFISKSVTAANRREKI